MALITLASLKDYLSITGTGKDDILNQLLIRVDGLIKKYCNSELEKRTRTDEKYDGDGSDSLLVKNTPIISVTSLYDDVDRVYGASTQIAAADFYTHDDEGEVILYDTTFSRAKQNIKITYDSGYKAGSRELLSIEQAAVEWAGILFKASTHGDGTLGFGNLSAEGQSITVETGGIPTTVKKVLDLFKVRPIAYHRHGD
jgi:hypothetical protein